MPSPKPRTGGKVNEVKIPLSRAELDLAERAAKLAKMTLRGWASACIAGESSRYLRVKERDKCVR